MSTEQFKRCPKVRKEVLGEDHVKAPFDNADNFKRDFQNMVTEYCWGGTWGRGRPGAGCGCRRIRLSQYRPFDGPF